MSLSTFVTLIVCVASVMAAWLDHGETYNAFKSSTGKLRRAKLLKLILLWGVPVASLIATALSIREASTSEQTAEDARRRLAAAEIKQAPRHITDEQRDMLRDCLSSCPKGKVRIAAAISDAEATKFAENIENVLTNLAFEVDRPSYLPNGLMRPDSILFSGHLGLTIVVKEPQTAPRYAGHIQHCFINSGIPMKGLVNLDAASNTVEIIVGQKE